MRKFFFTEISPYPNRGNPNFYTLHDITVKRKILLILSEWLKSDNFGNFEFLHITLCCDYLLDSLRQCDSYV